MKQTIKQSYELWTNFHRSLQSDASVEVSESYSEKHKRITLLEANPEEWFKYYFPKYCTANPAPFHIKSTKRILANPEWYEVRAWSRELAKSTRTMFEVLYLALTGKKHNIILCSSSHDNAVRLLNPYKIALEVNPRIKNDYGLLVNYGNWTEDEFITTAGVAFRAVGAGESPRGAKNENIRPDILLIDDIDTDEDCRNPDIIDKRWSWIERALIGTRSISEPLLVLFCGNIIAEYCCITEAIKKADKADIINIRTNGKSSWAKNSEEHIDRVLSKISFASAQGEYFNNPITEGKVFKDLTFGKCPNLSVFKKLVVYGDPSPSNNEVKKNSYKTAVLVGKKDSIFYILKVFLEQTTNSNFVQWFYNMKDYVGGASQLYNYIENNTLQDPFYQQVFKPLFFQFQKQTGHLLSITPDDRKKPDKYARIEGNLEPLNRMGCIIFNEAEQNNPHMQRLVDQFKAVSPKNKHLIDGPDAVEGAVYKLNNDLNDNAVYQIIKRNPATNKHRL
jgi:hypothetical protein